MLNFNNVMIGTDKPQELAEFYEKVFDRKPDMNDGGFYGWNAGNTFFSIGEHSEVHGKSKEPQRIILNFETKDVKGEFERIRSLGAEVIKEPYGLTKDGEETDDEDAMFIATFADPDGNYFQLMPPWDLGAN